MSSEELRDLGLRLLAGVVHGGNRTAKRMLKRGVSGFYFPDEVLGEAWRYLVRLLDEEGRVVSVDEIEHEFDVVLPAVRPSEVEGIASRIASIQSEAFFGAGMTGVREACAAGKLDVALDRAEAQVRRAKALHYGAVSASTIYEFAGAVSGLYDRAKRGDIGIPFPWPTMNSCTMGMWERTLTLFVARPGIGKTMSSLIVAGYAREHSGADVLYISPEMFKWEIAERFVALESKVNYGRVIQGSLRPEEEERFRRRLAEYSGPHSADENQFWIVDRTDVIGSKDDLGALESLIEDYQNRSMERGRKLLLIVDALYKLGRSNDRSEQMVQNILWAVRMGVQYNCAVLATTQFNRGAGSGGADASLENLGLTDVAGWEAHQIFALWRNGDMKSNRRMGFKALKVRRLASDGKNEFMVHWDFDTMSFGEIASESRFVDSGYSTVDDEDVKF